MPSTWSCRSRSDDSTALVLLAFPTAARADDPPAPPAEPTPEKATTANTPDIDPKKAPEGILTKDEVKNEKKNEAKNASPFAIFVGATASLSNPSANGQLGFRYALSERWRDDPPRAVAGNAIAVFGARLATGDAALASAATSNALALLRLAERGWTDGEAVDPALALPVYVRDHVADTITEREALRAERAAAAAVAP